MLTDSEKQKLAAALEQLEAEKNRRTEEKIEKGNAVRVPPLVVGVPESALIKERALRDDAGREIIYGLNPGDPEVIVTGVPRAGRDTLDLDPPVQVHNVSKKPDTENRRPEGEALRLPEGDSLRAAPYTPAPEPIVSEPRRILVQIEQPTERNPGGTIAEGFERHTDSQVRVYDTDGNLLGSAALRPGDDVEAAAKRLLREKHGRHGSFYPLWSGAELTSKMIVHSTIRDGLLSLLKNVLKKLSPAY